MPRGRVNLTNPVNWKHPLNKGRILWMLGLPQWSGGNTWFDLCRNFIATFTQSTGGGDGFPAGRQSRQSLSCKFAIAATGTRWNISDPAKRLAATSMTIAAWINPDQNSTSEIASNSGGGAWRIRRDSAQTITFLDRNSNNLSTTDTVPINTWSRIVATGNAAGLSIYINGKLSASNGVAFAGSGALGATTVLLGVAAAPASEGFSGLMDDFGYWSRALAAAEVAEDFRQSSIGYSSLLNRFDAGQSAFDIPPQPGGQSSLLTLTGAG